MDAHWIFAVYFGIILLIGLGIAVSPVKKLQRKTWEEEQDFEIIKDVLP